MEEKRITVVAGHYGSGKTEFSVSLAVWLARRGRWPHYALVDLDIANPYFRSRERKDLLESLGVRVYGSFYDREITAELPALTAAARAPLENDSCRTIIDLGGDDSGAKVIHQFRRHLTADNHSFLLVVNGNRPRTRDPDGVLEHLYAIQAVTGLTVHGLINNTHMLRETTADDILRGHRLCRTVSEQTGLPLVCNAYPAALVDPAALADLAQEPLLPLGMYLRESWLDRAPL